MSESPYQRSQFVSRWPFILAAVGSAAGLGNLWRFPYLAYEYGGAAFFVAYFICLLVIGLPFLILENGMGQITGKAAPGSLAAVNKRGNFRVIGWLGVMNMFAIMAFYVVIAGWVINYLWLAPSLGWETDSVNYFTDELLNKSEDISIAGGFVPHLLWATLLIYLLVFFAIRRGTSGLSAVAKWVTPLPFILLVVLAINSSTLPGASNGLYFFLVPDWSKLANINIWFIAITQAFFSLSIGTATMFALGSLLNKSVNVKTSAMAIMGGEVLISFVSGLAVFGVLGYMAQYEGVPLSEVITSGFGLAFVTLPKALALLPFAQEFFAVIFFVALFALAFTSIVAMMESILGGLMGSNVGWTRTRYLLIVSFLSLLVGLLAMRGNGHDIMSIINHFINHSIITVALIEAVLIGWVYGAKRLRLTLNENSGSEITCWFDISVKFIIPLFLTTLLVLTVMSEFQQLYNGFAAYYLLLYGVGALICIIVGAFALSALDKPR